VGQHHDIGLLAAAKALQQRQRRREIGVDLDRVLRLISAGQRAEPLPSMQGLKAP
jgi:hypothetical protein